MGIFKQMKDMKDMVNAAPGLVEQAQQMGAQAQQMAAAQQAATQARMAQFGGAQPGAFGQPGTFGQQAAPTGPDFEPIDGVTLEQFAAVGKAVAAYNYDGTKLPQIAASRGIPAHAWESASHGWNDRLMANPAVAQRYNQLYRAS
jgi:phage-related minor tail protein